MTDTSSPVQGTAESFSNMAFERVLKPGTPIKLSAGGNDFDSKVLRNRDGLLSVTDEGLSRTAREAEVSFFTPQALYLMTAEIQSREGRDAMGLKPTLVLKRPERWTRIQRRHDFRILVRVPVEMVHPDVGLVIGYSHNISASGILVELKELVPLKSFAQITFRLGAGELRKEPTVFVRRVELTRVDGDFYGMRFTDQSVRDQELLVRLLLRLNMELTT